MSATLHPLQIRALAVRARFFPPIATRIAVRTARPVPALVLPPPIVQREDGTYPIRDLLRLCAEVSGVLVNDIRSQRRQGEVVRPRQLFCWLARRFTTRSYPEMGQVLGGRDHTTCLHAVRRIERLIPLVTAPANDTPGAWAEALLAIEWPNNIRGPAAGPPRRAGK